MRIQQRLKACLADRAAGHRIADVRIGLGYTAVMLGSGHLGLAGTPLRHLSSSCNALDAMLPLNGRPADELLEMITSKTPLETALGLATANALINHPSPALAGGDVLKMIDVNAHDHVGMVGHFAPMVNAVKNTGAELTIFEQLKQPMDDLRPTDEIPERLPDCSICLLTATSIVNDTFDDVIESASRCRSVVVLGASTPLLSEVFVDTPVTCLSGVIVTHPEKTLHIVSCGGGMRRFKTVTQKVNLPL